MIAAPGSLMRTGADGGPGTRAVVVTAGAADGGDLTVGRLIGGRIELYAFRGGLGGGAITVAGRLASTGDVILRNDLISAGQPPVQNGLAAPPPPPAISILADVTAAGDVNVTSIDQIYVEAGVTVRANDDGDAVGGLTFHAARSIEALTGSVLGSGAAGRTPSGAVEIIAGYPVPRANGAGGNLLTDRVFGGAVRLEARAGLGAAGDVTSVGQVDAGSLDLIADGAARLGPTVSRGYVRGSAGTNFTITGAVAAAGEAAIDARRGTLNLDPGASVRADADGDGAGALTLRASSSVSMAAGALLATGLSGGVPTADIAVTAGHAFGLGGPDAGDLTFTTVRGRDVTLTARRSGGVGGAVNAGSASALGQLTLNGYDVNLLAGSVLRGDSDGVGAGGVSITAGRNVTGAAGSLVASGLTGGPGRGAILVDAGTAAGGVLQLDGVQGGSVSLTSLAGAAGSGDLRLTSGLSAPGAIALTAGGSVDLVTVAGGGDVDVAAGGSARFGASTAAGRFAVQAGGALDALGPVTAGGLLRLRSTGGALSASGALTAGGDLELSGTDITTGGLTAGSNLTVAARRNVAVSGPATARGTAAIDALTGSAVLTGAVRGDSDGDGDGGVSLAMSGDLTGAATSLIAVGSDATPTGVLNLSSSAGSLTLGRLSAGRLQVSAPGLNGRVILLGDAVGVTGIDIQAGARVRTAGLSSTAGAVSIASGGDVAFSAGAQVNGFSGLTVEAASNLTVATGAALSGGYGSGAPDAAVWPTAPSPTRGGVRLTVADIDLRGSVRAYAGATGLGDVFIAVRNAGSTATVGGEVGLGGFHLSDAEVGRISARNLLVMAGTLTTPSGSLTARDLSLDPARIGGLSLGAGAPGSIRVTGSVRSSGSTPANLRLGFLLPGQAAQNAPALAPVSAVPGFTDFVPQTIVVTGSLGSDGRLGEVGLVARGDVLMGDDAFITETSSPNFDPRRPGAASASGRLLVQADALQIASAGRVLQQNTSLGGQHSGLRIGAPTAERPLIVTFSFLGGTTQGVPSIIDLYGVIEQSGGALLTGLRATDAPHLTADSITVIDDYKLNACTFGRSARCISTPGTVFRDPFEIIDPEHPVDERLDVRDLLTDLFAPPDPEEEEDRLFIGVPITGSGNEDLWFGGDREPGR